MPEKRPKTETAYGVEVELSLPLHVIVARLRARFDRRVVKGVQDIAHDAGTTEEEVLARLETGSDPYADLLEQTLRGIERKASAEHRRAMARVAANAWSGDDATVDRATLVVDTIADLQPVHVRVLVAASKLNDKAGGWPQPALGPPTRPAPVTVDGIARGSAVDENTARGVVGQLVARGLLEVESVASVQGYVWTDHALTQLGADVLNALG
jgi:hypothetical protein